MSKRKSLLSVAPPRPRGGPIRPEPAPPDGPPPPVFKRGTKYPRAITWFGFRTFWGHLWSLLASAIATEDIDSRDWMRADLPRDLVRRIAELLGGDPNAASLTEALGRDVWIDFVADTGDDVSVSRAVAELMFESYEVDDPEVPGTDLVLPRGDVLLFGGDTAYPVANELEIHNRVVVPFNHVLHDRIDGKPRALLGVPGNHDWFAGLDGFGRMFRAPLGTVDRASLAPPSTPGATKGDKVEHTTQLQHFFEWVEALRIGKRVEKRAALPLLGYAPVQSASYWALPLAPGLDLWGPDRQLTTLDTRQRHYFASRREEAPNGLCLCLADPPFAFLEPHRAGQEILRSLDLSFKEDQLFALTGDIHHYCRMELPGGGLQVTAGGGGAFLHPAKITRAGLPPPAAELPGPIASRRLMYRIPFLLAIGRAGLLLHAALAILYGPMQKFAWTDGRPSLVTAAVTGGVLWLILWAVGATRDERAWKVVSLSGACSAMLAAVPFGMNAAAMTLGPRWPYATASLFALAFVAMILVGVFVFGVYLMLLTMLGIATDQGFGPLAHPGYKHFVRLRVRRDGRKIEGWAIGKIDTLRRADPIVIVDRFEWQNPRADASHRADQEGLSGRDDAPEPA
jgi:hypothetical protein